MTSSIHKLKLARATRRQLSVKGAVRGSIGRPRLSVFRSLKHIYAQVIDDTTGKTLVSASSLDKDVRASLKNGGNKDAAKAIGAAVAKKAAAQGVTDVAFDRAGYRYHGRIKALADAAREAGLKF
jgi:large subunit ribosomal protein L18